jgi:hypothetical protein
VPIRKEVANEYRNPEITTLMEMLDDTVKLKAHIMGHYEAISSLPWENQVEYSKRYRLKQLIAHTEE